MNTRRRERISAFIQETVSEFLERKLQDPRLRSITITDVEVTPDLKQAKIWFSVLGEKEEVQAASLALQNATGLFRRELAATLHMRHVPELSFHLDSTWQRGARVEELLRQIALEQEEHDERS